MPRSAHERLVRAKREGPQQPLRRCLRRQIPNLAWGHEDMGLLKRVNKALRLVDRDFEVIYDRALSPEGGPGHCLYRVAKRGGVEVDDTLTLEFPLQWGLASPWPQGGPRPPGMWLLDVLKGLMRASRARTIEEAQTQEHAQVDAEEDREEAAREKSLDDYAQDSAKDIAASAYRGKQVLTVPGLKEPDDDLVRITHPGETAG